MLQSIFTFDSPYLVHIFTHLISTCDFTSLISDYGSEGFRFESWKDSYLVLAIDSCFILLTGTSFLSTFNQHYLGFQENAYVRK